MSDTFQAQIAHTDGEIALIANHMRRDIIEMLSASGSGHPGGSLSAADIVATLFFSGLMNYDENDPQFENRDRFILSKGHAAPVLYAALVQIGYVPREELVTLRQLGSRFQGHPDCHCCPGVEVCTGSLGQGMSISCGLALGFKLDAAHNNTAEKHVYTLLGDGEMQEGQNWEAIMFAAHRNLDNLTAIVDWNNLQIDGHVTDVCSLGDLEAKFKAFGWNTLVIDGHNISEIRCALETANAHEGAPTVIIAKTIKGKGVSFMEDLAKWHGSTPNAEQTAQAFAEIDAAAKKLAVEEA